MEKTATSGYAPANGLTMYHEIHGEGTIPLVLIHGGGSTIESSFGRMIPLLSRHGKVIAVELQAHGRTSDRKAPESFEQDADDVAALLKYLGVEKANVLGFSNGGTTTIQIAIRHPEIVNRIVLVSASYTREGFIPGCFDGLTHATLDNMPADLKEAYLAVAPRKEDLQIMFEKDKERMLAFRDLTDAELRSIHAPALVMVADHDVVTPEHAVKMSRLMPNARLAILPGIHGSCIGEVCAIQRGSHLPEMTAVLVEEFLNE